MIRSLRACAISVRRATFRGVICGLSLSVSARAHQFDRVGGRVNSADATAGSRSEELIIDLLLAKAGLPISLRPFAPPLLDSVLATMHSRNGRRDSLSQRVLRRTPTWSSVWYNSARATSWGSGPVWTGRGSTFAASGGFVARLWHVSLAVRPVAFWGENRTYRPSRSVSPTGFADPRISSIDTPYRFGNAAYGRVDAGESYARLDLGRISAGVSNASQVWGPARLYPLMLSANAGGFPHAFLETNRPLSVGIGRLSWRWIAGRLVASSFAPAHDGTGVRAAVGAVGSFTPRGFSGVEFGGSRFFHSFMSSIAYDYESLTLPFSALLKNRVRVSYDPRRETNQLASLFARIAPPTSPVEVYGEFLRDDHSANLRDLIGEPDHDAAYVIGVRRKWLNSESNQISTLTIENANGSISHLAQVRDQAPVYIHGLISEGHTARGLALGSPVMPGGGAFSIVVNRISETEGWSIGGEIAHGPQSREGGSYNGRVSGYYSLSGTREFGVGKRWWTLQGRIQPGYGDVPGTNLGVAVRVAESR